MLRNEKQISETLAGCYRYASLICDDYQRFGLENFIAGLEYCLNNNIVLNNQIVTAAENLGLKVGFVKLDGKIVDIKER